MKGNHQRKDTKVPLVQRLQMAMNQNSVEPTSLSLLTPSQVVTLSFLSEMESMGVLVNDIYNANSININAKHLQVIDNEHHEK